MILITLMREMDILWKKKSIIIFCLSSLSKTLCLKISYDRGKISARESIDFEQ